MSKGSIENKIAVSVSVRLFCKTSGKTRIGPEGKRDNSTNNENIWETFAAHSFP